MFQLYFSVVVTQNYQQSRVPSISYLAVVGGKMFSFSSGKIDLDEAVIE